MEISFHDEVTYDIASDVFKFFAHADGKTVRCSITEEAIMFGFGAPFDREKPLESFESNRDKIQLLAARLIREKKFDENGDVLICEADLR